MQQSVVGMATPCVARGMEPHPPAHQAFASSRKPPAYPRSAGGLSGRPTCRIYPSGQVWVLEFERTSGGWMEHASANAPPNGPLGPSGLTFPTLVAAIGYAERHGLDYRVVAPPRRRVAVNRNRHASTSLPKSWMARLSRNGRNGDIYHG